jgi:D-3-phosphoglycerate dehydrogenase
MKVLATDGIAQSGIDALESKGFEVLDVNIASGQLENYINKHQIDAIVVGGSTEIREELIDNCPSLKLIGRSGVSMDNIDVDYAIDQGLHVINTPEATANSVAELVFAHLFGMARFLHQSNREMPLEGDFRFHDMNREFGNGMELRGKTLGIVGFGTVGQEVAKIALGLGMKVIASDPLVEGAPISIEFFNGQRMMIPIETSKLDDLLKESDFITVHTDSQEGYVIGQNEIKKMKKGVGIINVTRGGIIDEVALVNSIEDKHVKFAGLDVFENEPKPEIQLLMNPELSLTPHIAASTIEAHDRIGTELAEQIVKLLDV